MDKINYGVFKELFKIMGINPHDFWAISREHVTGFFPNMPHREPLISVDRLAHVLWEGRENHGK